tara:strand:- start:7349 stop:7945 length:597 start_codon:yes stop_codon:yes gene_type:complete
MKTYTVFDDYKVARFHCDDEMIYKNTTMVQGLDTLFTNPDLDPNLVDQNGKGLSTFTVPKYKLFEVNGIDLFKQWFTDRALETAEYFGHTDATAIVINRAWSNKIWKGCSGNVHDHDPESHAMAVFYPLAPEGSADLAFVRDGVDHARNHEVLSENLAWQDVREGDVLFHETRAWHTVSEHSADSPRIVFVIEFSYLA